MDPNARPPLISNAGLIALDDPGRGLRADDECDRRWQGQQAGLERRQAGDELQVLGDEEEVADGHEDGQEVDDECGAELGLPEQGQVDHRVRQPP